MIRAKRVPKTKKGALFKNEKGAEIFVAGPRQIVVSS